MFQNRVSIMESIQRKLTFIRCTDYPVRGGHECWYAVHSITREKTMHVQLMNEVILIKSEIVINALSARFSF